MEEDEEVWRRMKEKEVKIEDEEEEKREGLPCEITTTSSLSLSFSDSFFLLFQLSSVLTISNHNYTPKTDLTNDTLSQPTSLSLLLCLLPDFLFFPIFLFIKL